MEIISSAATDAKHVEFLSGVLPRISIFSTLEYDQIRKLLYFISVVKFEKGETIMKRGDVGDRFYVIHEGSVEATAEGLLGKSVIREMGPGDFFGELALLLNQPRSADIECLEETYCYSMDQGSFSQLIEKNPEIGEIIKKAARERFENYR